MSLWETFTLKQENAKELKLDDLKEPSEEDFVYIYCCLCFGGICNNDELKEISEIVYKAYLREKRKKEDVKMEKYFTNCVVADEDWKTQLARGYSNIPANEEVKMIQEEYINFYGVWCIVEWKGNRYYTSQRNIRKEK